MRTIKTNFRQLSHRLKADFVSFHDDILDYVCITQRVFSATLASFFTIHSVIAACMGFLDVYYSAKVLFFSATEILLSLSGYLLFRYYFPSHRKRLLLAAYLNILQLTLLIELQYLIFGEFISYTIMVCLILSSSLTVIGHVWGYASIVALCMGLDIVITIHKNYEIMCTRTMYNYIVDAGFILLFSVGINLAFSILKYRDFANRRKILHLGERDSLTGLFNRRALEETVHSFEGLDTLCVMILLDLDNFKALNDTLGHYAGDRCLCEVSEALQGMFRQSDCIARLGGDEFVIFMPEISQRDTVLARTELLLEKIPRSYPCEGGEVSVTCSVGVAFSQGNGGNLYETLYKAADAAMYRSKAGGKNTVTLHQPTEAAGP